MPNSIKGSKTEKNLLASFAGESQARNRYTYFCGQAKKEGFEQIASFFLDTAEQEVTTGFVTTQMVPPTLSTSAETVAVLVRLPPDRLAQFN